MFKFSCFSLLQVCPLLSSLSLMPSSFPVASCLLYLYLPLLLFSLFSTQSRSCHTLIKNLNYHGASLRIGKNFNMVGPQGITISVHCVSHSDHIPFQPHSSLFSFLKASSSLCHRAFAHDISSAWNGLPPRPTPTC